VNDNYVDANAVAYPKLTNSALHGLVESLDPHSEFLEAKDYQDLQEEVTSEFVGIGIQIEYHKDHVVVIDPIKDSPSDRAGVKRGDQLVKIDGASVEKNASIDSIVDRLRGKPKSHVNVVFYRPTTKKEFAVNLVREVIKFDTVKPPQMLSEGIGYIQISEFTEHTGEEFINALNKLASKGLAGLVLDLRNNPGGLLDSAVAVAEPFFKKGDLIVYTQGRKPKDREEYRAEAPEPPLGIPTVVLINENSASAAEIVAGAMRDAGKAIIVGERSFGKGSVQSIYPLKNGQGMRLTTARYYTPSGVTIHQKGVEPHVSVVMTNDEDQNIRLQMTRDDVKENSDFKERFGVNRAEDRQLEAGEAILRAIILLEGREPDTKAIPANAAAKTPAT
jgi:carboxyl-terminal processing protease